MDDPRGRESVGISVQQVAKSFDSRNGEVIALEDAAFSVSAGEFVCIVGPSGCGKSTLLKILAGLLSPTSGRVEFDGGSAAEPRSAIVFQEHGLFPWLKVVDNVAFGLEAQGTGTSERRRAALELLDQFGIGAFAQHYPHELSGGMRQRAAIARAMLIKPQILLMDEPFSALDAQSTLVLQEEVLRLWKDNGQTVIYVTHDIEEAVMLGDRILVMTGRPGRIREEVEVPLERPRDLKDRSNPKISEITWHIWRAIEGQVRQTLHLPA